MLLQNWRTFCCRASITAHASPSPHSFHFSVFLEYIFTYKFWEDVAPFPLFLVPFSVPRAFQSCDELQLLRISRCTCTIVTRANLFWWCDDIIRVAPDGIFSSTFQVSNMKVNRENRSKILSRTFMKMKPQKRWEFLMTSVTYQELNLIWQVSRTRQENLPGKNNERSLFLINQKMHCACRLYITHKYIHTVTVFSSIHIYTKLHMHVIGQFLGLWGSVDWEDSYVRSWKGYGLLSRLIFLGPTEVNLC